MHSIANRKGVLFVSLLACLLATCGAWVVSASRVGSFQVSANLLRKQINIFTRGNNLQRISSRLFKEELFTDGFQSGLLRDIAAAKGSDWIEEAFNFSTNKVSKGGGKTKIQSTVSSAQVFFKLFLKS